jgi:hypothetical protein
MAGWASHASAIDGPPVTSNPHRLLQRRRFLQQGGMAAVATLALGPVGRLLASAGAPAGLHPGFGPLQPVRDLSTSLPLLALPAGFSYLSFGWAGESLPGDQRMPDKHDGMGIVRRDGDVLTLVRNHEIKAGYGSFAPPAATYDTPCAGGTVTLRFDTSAGKLLDAHASLSGTLVNCSGGTTPWGTWLSCEEIVVPAGVATLESVERTLAHDHGFVFEVPATGESRAEPLRAMGQFKHEAATVDPRSGIVYLTEDHDPDAGFYRFVPQRKGELLRGGRLQMLRARGAPDLRRGHRRGARFAVEWVEIEHPERGVGGRDGESGVLEQGLANGGSMFTRLEGCIAGDDVVYFTATDGGDARCGQVWAYHPQARQLVLLYESTDPAILDYPDNIVISPRGGLVVCQDSEGDVQHLYGLTQDAGLFAFARNNTQLDGQMGFAGDYRDSEWAGSCFSPDGKWLFANMQEPGFSVAITGPWRRGLI